jgi:propionyl-CoA carboxylase alpha chain
MIAKLCTHAATRDAAIDLMADALDTFVIDGIQHNIAFLAAVMANERWRSGAAVHRLHRRGVPRRLQRHRGDSALTARLVTVAAAVDHVETRRRHQISGQMAAGRMVKWSPVRIVKLGADWHEVELTEAGPSAHRVDHGGEAGERTVESDWTPGNPVWHGRIDGESVAVQVRPVLNGCKLSHRGVEIEAHVFTPREAELARIMPEQAAPTPRRRCCARCRGSSCRSTSSKART